MGIAGTLALALSGCASGPSTPALQPAASPRFAPMALAIAHVNDHHSQLDGFSNTELRLDGTATQATLGGFARLTTLFKQAQARHQNLLKIHAGDALTGSLYYTLFKGAADAQLMNTVCFDAFELGNHEFDDGDASLRHFLDRLHAGPCQTPVLAANVAPQPGTPLAPVDRPELLRPYVIHEVEGVKVAVIGIVIKGKTVNSSRPLPSTAFSEETATAQATINALKTQGIRHFVLVTHQGYRADLAMAAALTDVDAIIGADSHTLLGDFSAVGLSSAGPYPTVARNQDGAPVCIVQAWEYTKAFGLLTLSFDAHGAVQSCGGEATLVIGEPFRRQASDGQWMALTDAQTAALRDRLARQPGIQVVAPDPGAASLLAGYTHQITEAKARIIGTAADSLCLVRVPGEATNRSGGTPGCETANTLARGSGVAQAVAQAFLSASKRADFALENAGGVRVPLAAGPLSMNAAFSLLPYANVIVELDLSGAEVLAALEEGVANHLDAKLSDGSHPYAAGLRWDLDMRQPKGRRLSKVQVKDRRTGTWSDLSPGKTYVLATHDFLAAGKDGYATLGAVSASGRAVNTYLLYTQTFADWVSAQGTVQRTAREDDSHQHVVTAAGATLR